jgi:hypothetical protein
VLSKSLFNDINYQEFIELLNKRVFWWPTLNRLNRHYLRYQQENPVILRVNTKDILLINKQVEFCHLNSGATRCHPSYGGNAPTRGYETFLAPDQYSKSIASVAEVTFPGICVLPNDIWIGNSPNGKWAKV